MPVVWDIWRTEDWEAQPYHSPTPERLLLQLLVSPGAHEQSFTFPGDHFSFLQNWMQQLYNHHYQGEMEQNTSRRLWRKRIQRHRDFKLDGQNTVSNSLQTAIRESRLVKTNLFHEMDGRLLKPKPGPMWTHVEEPLAWYEGHCPPCQGPGQHLGECKGMRQQVLCDSPTYIFKNSRSQQTHR